MAATIEATQVTEARLENGALAKKSGYHSSIDGDTDARRAKACRGSQLSYLRYLRRIVSAVTY
jgi:hypothetical protein